MGQRVMDTTTTKTMRQARGYADDIRAEGAAEAFQTREEYLANFTENGETRQYNLRRAYLDSLVDTAPDSDRIIHDYEIERSTCFCDSVCGCGLSDFLK